jgi:glutamyl-tRNA synthetase
LGSNSNAELRELIRKIALTNSVRHGGKAQTGPVVGKILGEQPDFRTKVQEVTALVNEVIMEVNALSLEEQLRIIEEKWPEAASKEKSREERHLPPLAHAEKYKQIVTRYSPNPDCVLHLGSARAIILSHEYARIYRGKFLLRFEDTDPKLKRPVLEFYDSIREDLRWLECKPDEEYVQSDRIPIYYEYAEKLLKYGNAYVCTCKSEEFRRKILSCSPCECRSCSKEENLERWHRMLQGGYAEGEAVVRVRTDLDHPNPAVRDWPALRVLDTEKHPHPRVGSKYRVWPLYNLAAGVDDHLMSITHIIRGKEHLTNQVRQEYMYRHLGWKYPETIHYGRLKITGASLSKSKIVQGMREGLYKNWDDPRLATFMSLRKRGICSEAIRRLMIDIGPKTSDVVLSWENLYAHNRKILDPIANRYFFVLNPIELKVKSVPKDFPAKLQLHPDDPKRGFRQYVIVPTGEDKSTAFWVSSKDVDSSKTGKILRLMELFNVKILSASIYGAEAVFESESYDEARNIKAQLIHWVPVGQDMPCNIVMPDASMSEGVAEGACKGLKKHEIIQFERFGFVRVDKINNKLTAYYAHK